MSFYSGGVNLHLGQTFQSQNDWNLSHWLHYCISLSVYLSVIIFIPELPVLYKLTDSCENVYRPYKWTAQSTCDLQAVLLSQNNHSSQVWKGVKNFWPLSFSICTGSDIPYWPQSSRDLQVECRFPFGSDRPTYSGPTGRTFLLVSYNPIVRPESVFTASLPIWIFR